MVGFFQSKYLTTYESNSILSFVGDVTDDTASSLLYLSTLQKKNEGYEMYASFKTRLKYLYASEQGGLDSYEFFLMSCYYPDSVYGFDTICEVAKSDICNAVEDSSKPDTAPFIGGYPIAAVTAGEAYRFRPAAYDVDGDDMTFSIENKPGWASFDTATGSLTGTPSEADAGVYGGVVISVTDGESTSSLAAFSVTVSSYNSPPVILGTPHSTATSGGSYSFKPVAYDVDGDSITWSIENKPSWASFNTATGVLSGSPASSDSGTYSNIVISVTDGSETSSLDAFNIIVSAHNSAPTTSGTPSADVAVGVAYSFTPTAYDADGDALMWFINGMPDWMSFDSTTGAITGTPASGDKGVYSGISIVVSDGEYISAINDFAIEVINTAPTVTGTATAELQAGAATVSYRQGMI